MRDGKKQSAFSLKFYIVVTFFYLRHVLVACFFKHLAKRKFFCIFLSIVVGKRGSIARLPKRVSGSRTPISGVVEHIDVNKKGHGVWCQEDWHQGQVSNVDMIQEISNYAKNLDHKLNPLINLGFYLQSLHFNRLQMLCW